MWFGCIMIFKQLLKNVLNINPSDQSTLSMQKTHHYWDSTRQPNHTRCRSECNIKLYFLVTLDTIENIISCTSIFSLVSSWIIYLRPWFCDCLGTICSCQIICWCIPPQTFPTVLLLPVQCCVYNFAMFVIIFCMLGWMIEWSDVDLFLQ